MTEERRKEYFAIIEAYWIFFKRSLESFEQSEVYWHKLLDEANRLYEKFLPVNKEFAYVMAIAILRAIDEETKNVPEKEIMGDQMNFLDLAKEDRRWR